MKTCNCCKTEKPYSAFPKKKSTKDGYYGFCKVCKSAKDKQYREANALKLKAKFKEKYYANHEESLEKARERYANASEDSVARRKESKVAYTNAMSDTAKACKKEYDKKYFASEAGKITTLKSAHKRRAQKIATCDGTITTQALEELKISQNYKCRYCECILNFKGKGEVHLDHIKPLSKGGTHSITNVVWSCATCNLKKSNKLV